MQVNINFKMIFISLLLCNTTKSMYINAIKETIENRKTTQKEVAKKIPMSERQFGQALLKGDMKVSTLIRVAEILKVPVAKFFSGEKYQIDKSEKASSDDQLVYIGRNELYYLRNLNETLQKLVDRQEEELNRLKAKLAL